MATGIEQAQTTVPTCTDHKHQMLLSYCRTCHKRICEHCVKGPHSEHDWTFLQNHVRDIRNEGEKIAKEIREEIIAFLKRKKDGTAKKQDIAKLRLMQQNLKDLIDGYTDEMASQLDEYDEDLGDIDREIEEFEQWVVFFEKNIRTEYDSVVVEMEEEFHTKLLQHKMSKAESQSVMQRFQEGTIDKDRIKAIGRVERITNGKPTSKLDVTVINTVTHGESKILGIEVFSEKKAWIHCSGETETNLIDSDGRKLETHYYKTKFTDFLLNGNDQIYTKHNENFIAVLSSGSERKLCSTYLHPYGICHSKEGGILVCLTDCYLDDITPSSFGEIHHLDMTGKVKKRYNRNETDNTKLLTWPYRVAQNINSDLCVCDNQEASWRSRLVVIDQDSRIRFAYEGHSSMKKLFRVNCVVCDSLGRILLCDYLNDAIHMLSIDGQFIQFLLTPRDRLSKPTSLATCGGAMWVGNSEGVIQICELKQQ